MLLKLVAGSVGLSPAWDKGSGVGGIYLTEYRHSRLLT